MSQRVASPAQWVAASLIQQSFNDRNQVNDGVSRHPLFINWYNIVDIKYMNIAQKKHFLDASIPSSANDEKREIRISRHGPDIRTSFIGLCKFGSDCPLMKHQPTNFRSHEEQRRHYLEFFHISEDIDPEFADSWCACKNKNKVAKCHYKYHICTNENEKKKKPSNSLSTVRTFKHAHPCDDDTCEKYHICSNRHICVHGLPEDGSRKYLHELIPSHSNTLYFSASASNDFKIEPYVCRVTNNRGIFCKNVCGRCCVDLNCITVVQCEQCRMKKVQYLPSFFLSFMDSNFSVGRYVDNFNKMINHNNNKEQWQKNHNTVREFTSKLRSHIESSAMNTLYGGQVDLETTEHVHILYDILLQFITKIFETNFYMSTMLHNGTECYDREMYYRHGNNGGHKSDIVMKLFDVVHMMSSRIFSGTFSVIKNNNFVSTMPCLLSDNVELFELSDRRQQLFEECDDLEEKNNEANTIDNHRCEIQVDDYLLHYMPGVIMNIVKSYTDVYCCVFCGKNKQDYMIPLVNENDFVSCAIHYGCVIPMVLLYVGNIDSQYINWSKHQMFNYF